MLAYNVFDKHDTDIGHVSGVWTEPQGQIAFVGVKTTWLAGKTHVIPAQGIEVNHQGQTIRVPYSVDTVKNAPASDPGDEVEYTTQREVQSYYGQHGLQQRKENVEIEESGDASRVQTSAGTPANRIREQREKPRSQRQQS